MFPWTCKCKFQLSQDHKGVGNVELKWIVSYLVKSECGLFIDTAQVLTFLHSLAGLTRTL